MNYYGRMDKGILSYRLESKGFDLVMWLEWKESKNVDALLEAADKAATDEFRIMLLKRAVEVLMLKLRPRRPDGQRV